MDKSTSQKINKETENINSQKRNHNQRRITREIGILLSWMKHSTYQNLRYTVKIDLKGKFSLKCQHFIKDLKSIIYTTKGTR